MALTLSKCKAAAVRLSSVRAQIAILDTERDYLTETLRANLPVWGPVRVSDTRSIFLAEGTLRVSPDADKLITLARTLGATDEQIGACVKTTAVAASVRERNARPDDK